MVHYKLMYFDVRGKGEAIRQLFRLAGKPFEDVRVTMDTWPNFKDDTPFGQLPVIEVDGRKIAQSNAILRFLGREFGFAGSTNLENAVLDELADLLVDTMSAPGIRDWPLVCLGITAGDRLQFFKEHVRMPLNKFAGLYEKFLVENGRSSLVLDNVTWVDVLAAETFVRFRDYGEPDCLEPFPHILELIERVHNLPEIKQHLAERKPTAY